MKKSALTKIISLVLALSFAIPASFAFYPVHQVEAQAGSGKAGACIAGLLAAIGVSTPAFIKETIGVSDGNGNTGNQLNTNANTNAISFNSCVLQPLAKVMIVALIRNIGASVVNWVNSGFEGKPLFVTDFSGTVLDAADQAAGTFIEGSELGFLCQDISLQIRVALALKYSQPFRQRATCTLTQIGQNVESFVDNNGGVGWDNWLQLTTEPQNNVYGAYAIAESELAERMARAANIKEKRITLAQGFLDFETCDEYETVSDVQNRLKSGGNFQAQAGTNYVTKNGPADSYQLPGSGFGSVTDFAKSQNQTGSGVLKGTGQTAQPVSVDTKPRCLKSSTKTPGTIIAGKLNSEFAKGDIQQAVATEIDDVIAATMNQLASKMIQGAQGLLGLSKRSSYSNQNFYDKYQRQYYGMSQTSSIDIGATSPLEDYTVSDYNAAANLINGNSQVLDINSAVNQATNQSIQTSQAQQTEINNALGTNSTEVNSALLKTASQSSTGSGIPAKAVDGVKDGNVSAYNIPSSTGEEQNPWWEVDLGSKKDIKEVRVWRVTNKPVSETLEVIRVVASDDTGNSWTSDYIAPTDSSPNPLVIPVNSAKRYVKIEKKGTLDTQCRPSEGYRDTVYESCYHPLELAEVEVITPVSFSIKTATTTSGTGSSSSTGSTVDDGIPATSTVSWIVTDTANTVTGSVPLTYALALTALKPVSNLKISSSLSKNGSSLPFTSVFSTTDFTYGTQGGQQATYTIDTGNVGTANLGRVSVAANGKYVFKVTAQKTPGATSGTYTLSTYVTDDGGNVLDEQIAEFVVQ